MALTVTWNTKVINVLQADLNNLGSGIFELDMNQFRKDLNALQAASEGIPFETTHNHTAPVDIGGITLARVVELINGYTVTFENLQYAVNLVGANTNLQDVANVNQVSIRAGNTAGLVDNFKINELWRIHGMDIAAALIVDDSTRKSGTDINQTIVESPPGTVTITRVP